MHPTRLYPTWLYPTHSCPARLYPTRPCLHQAAKLDCSSCVGPTSAKDGSKKILHFVLAIFRGRQRSKHVFLPSEEERAMLGGRPQSRGSGCQHLLRAAPTSRILIGTPGPRVFQHVLAGTSRQHEAPHSLHKGAMAGSPQRGWGGETLGGGPGVSAQTSGLPASASVALTIAFPKL